MAKYKLTKQERKEIEKEASEYVNTHPVSISKKGKIAISILSLLTLGGIITSSIFITKYLITKNSSGDKITLTDSKNKTISHQRIGYTTYTFTTNDSRLSTNNLTAVAQQVGDSDIILDEKVYCYVDNKTITSYVLYDASDVKYKGKLNFDLIFNFSNGESGFAERKNSFTITYDSVIGDNILENENYCFSNVSESDNRNITLTFTNNDTNIVKTVDTSNFKVSTLSNSGITLNSTPKSVNLSEDKKTISVNIPYTSSSSEETLEFSVDYTNGEYKYSFDGLTLTSLDAITPQTKSITTTKTNNNVLLFNLADDSDENTYKIQIDSEDRSKAETFVQLQCGETTKTGNTLSVPIYLLDNAVSFNTNIPFDIRVSCSGKTEYTKIIKGFNFTYTGKYYRQDSTNKQKYIQLDTPNKQYTLSYNFTLTNGDYIDADRINVKANLWNNRYMRWIRGYTVSKSLNTSKTVLTITITLPALPESEYKEMKGKVGELDVDIRVEDTKFDIKVLPYSYKVACSYV